MSTAARGAQRAFEEDNSSLLDSDVLRFVFDKTDTGKLTKSKLLEAAITKDDVRALAVLVDVGAIKNAAQREKAINFAMENQKTEALAWLMDYKNKTADLAAEAARAEARAAKADADAVKAEAEALMAEATRLTGLVGQDKS